MTKQNHVTLRLSAAEAAEIQTEAGAAGMSVSAFIRAAVRERAQLGLLAAELRAEIQAQATERDAKLATLAADLKTVQDALANQVNRGYFIKVTQHLSKQLAALMAHHKIIMPREES